MIGSNLGWPIGEDLPAFNNLRASGDTTLDGWTDQAAGTSNIYQSIDEATVDDADYVISPVVAGSVADLYVRLYEGSTLIATWTHSGITTTFTTAEQTLTGLEFAAIADFTNLFIELDDNQGAAYRFPIGDPVMGVEEPMRVRYRYKKLA